MLIYSGTKSDFIIDTENEYVQDNEIGLHPCAYLHNYPRIENDPLDNVERFKTR